MVTVGQMTIEQTSGVGMATSVQLCDGVTEVPARSEHSTEGSSAQTKARREHRNGSLYLM